MMRPFFGRPSLIALLSALMSTSLMAHDVTLKAAIEKQRNNQQQLLARASDNNAQKQQLGVCRLTIELIDAKTQGRVAGNIKVSDAETGAALALSELVSRPNHWFSTDGTAVLAVPQTTIDVSAFYGMKTHLAKRRLDLRSKSQATVRLQLNRFYRTADRQLVSGNTHLHLNRISRSEADRYLRLIPAADDVDFLYVSHLRRVKDDATYITNQYDPQSLQQLSSKEVTLRFGEEHRHNFEPYGEGYGHVMFLDIDQLVEPVSLGPGITGQGTDGIPLQRGIKQAKQAGASVIWCHNTFGFEDLPNFLTGTLEALNIFDGGEHGSYKDSYYRYLNIGLRVPFSTGTDWFVYDLSRAYVPIATDVSSESWLRQLTAGKSFITNGTFLEFQVANAEIGDTIRLDRPSPLRVTGRAIGRNDFRALELVHNGEIVQIVESERHNGVFEASLDISHEVDEPGWIALRIPVECDKNEFDQPLFAHTSPIYIELAERRIFRQDVAQDLLVEMERNASLIQSKGIFATEAEKEAVLKVHRDGISALQRRMQVEVKRSPE